jgi:hypothetical protein
MMRLNRSARLKSRASQQVVVIPALVKGFQKRSVEIEGGDGVAFAGEHQRHAAGPCSDVENRAAILSG